MEREPEFPEWLVRVDPMLEAVQTNAAYECFWRRRHLHATRPADLLPDSITRYVIQFAVLLAGLAIVSLLVYWAGFCAAPLYLMLPVLVIRGRPRGKIAGNRVPRWLTHVFSPGGFREAIAIDLWMTGLGGREIAEAIYLEYRERTWWWLPLACLFGWLVGTGWLAAQGYMSAPSGIAAALALLFLTVEGTVSSIVAGMHLACSWAVESRTQTWGADNPLIETLGDAILKGLFAFVWLLVGSVGTWIALCVMGGIITFALPFLPETLGRHPGMWVLAGLMTIFGILMHRMRDSWRDGMLDRFNAALTDTNEAFERFMVRTVVGDRETSAWDAMIEPPSLESILKDMGPDDSRWQPLYPEERNKRWPGE